CSYVHCDVTIEDEVKNLVKTTVNSYENLDIMFSNAGILSPSDQTVLDLDISQFDHLFTVNVRGMALTVKHAARAMVEGHVRGSIVCTGSVAATHGTSRRVDYTMSKHAVLGLVRAASIQLAAHGIRVNCVSPNGLATPLTCASFGLETEELQKMYAHNARLKGIVLTPKHVADAVLFLASGDSEFVTGHNLVVDEDVGASSGGSTLHPFVWGATHVPLPVRGSVTEHVASPSFDVNLQPDNDDAFDLGDNHSFSELVVAMARTPQPPSS
ncbi:hypothetical protein PIB30_098599, partial [Stylosanthes scabra]|nr:hypothetical protein [Stylosanthes scabra]